MKKSRQPKKGERLDTTPKIPAYKYSLRNKTEKAYRDRLAVLKAKGVPFSFAKNAKLTPQRKGAITRVARKWTEFLNPSNRFVFVPVGKVTRTKVLRSGSASKAQVTKTGVFVPTPKTARRKTNIKIDHKTGRISTKIGKFSSHFKRYKSRDVVTNPKKIIEDAKKMGAETIFVSIKGHRGQTKKYGYSLARFLQYFDDFLADDIEEQIENESGCFKNYFGIEFVKYEWRKSR